jgi:hypothetical protein
LVVLEPMAYGFTSSGRRVDGVSTPTSVAKMSKRYIARTVAEAGIGAIDTCSFFHRITRRRLKPHTCGPSSR